MVTVQAINTNRLSTKNKKLIKLLTKRAIARNIMNHKPNAVPDIVYEHYVYSLRNNWISALGDDEEVARLMRDEKRIEKIMETLSKEDVVRILKKHTPMPYDKTRRNKYAQKDIKAHYTPIPKKSLWQLLLRFFAICKQTFIPPTHPHI